jgi:hypothetical protein
MSEKLLFKTIHHNNPQSYHGVHPTSAVWRGAQTLRNGGCLCLAAPGHVGKDASCSRLNVMAGVVVRAGLGHHGVTVHHSAQPWPMPYSSIMSGSIRSLPVP